MFSKGHTAKKRPKTPFLANYLFFSKNHISKTVHLTEKVENTFYRQNIPNLRFLLSEKLYEDQKVLFWGSFLLLKKSLSPPLMGTKQKKYISNFVQNFILIMIKIEPKLAGKVLDGNPYFPVYLVPKWKRKKTDSGEYPPFPSHQILWNLFILIFQKRTHTWFRFQRLSVMCPE